jgi:hypothetical protein
LRSARAAAGKPSRTFRFRDEEEPINFALSQREDFADLLWSLVSQLWNEGNILGIEFKKAIRPLGLPNSLAQREAIASQRRALRRRSDSRRTFSFLDGPFETGPKQDKRLARFSRAWPGSAGPGPALPSYAPFHCDLASLLRTVSLQSPTVESGGIRGAGGGSRTAVLSAVPSVVPSA